MWAWEGNITVMQVKVIPAVTPWGSNGIQTHTELWSLIGSRSSASSIHTCYMKGMTLCLCDKDHMSALWIKNTSEHLNPVGVSEFFLGFILTASITFTYILYPQCTHMIINFMSDTSIKMWKVNHKLCLLWHILKSYELNKSKRKRHFQDSFPEFLW